MPLTRTTSFKHQAEIIERTKDARYFGYFMEQGTGKTHVTIAVMTHLYRTGKIDAVLVLAPNGVHDNWAENEIPLHCNLDNYMVGSWHSNGGVKAKNLWDYVARGERGALDILVANIEAARTDAFVKSLKKFMGRKFLLVVDESTTIKNPKAAQTKAVMKIARNASYCRILTGTPITQSPLDLWSQCQVLDPLAIPYPSYTAFRRMFAIEQVLNFGHRSFNKVVGYQNQDYLAKLIAPFTARVLKKDCLDLPEKIYQIRYVELTPEQRRIYKDLTKQCLASVNDQVVSVTAVITMMLRLHQVTLGYIQTDDGALQSIPHNRIEILRDVLIEGTGKSIIWVRFKEDIHQVTALLREMGRQFAAYYGDVSAEDRHEAVDSFQNGDIDTIVATRAAARGLTLTAAERVIYYSQGFSLEDRLQSEDRAHRIGQKKSVVYTDLVAKGTIDDRVVDALKKKKQLSDAVLEKAQFEQLLMLEE